MPLGPILYAEDEENDVFFLERAFRRAEIACPLVVVPDGQQAIDYCLGTDHYSNRAEYPFPRLMLLDLNMPKKSGFEVLEMIRKDPLARTLPAIVFTSSLQNSDITQAYMKGANAYLVKSSNQEDLVTMAKLIRDFWLKFNRTVDF